MCLIETYQDRERVFFFRSFLFSLSLLRITIPLICTIRPRGAINKISGGAAKNWIDGKIVSCASRFFVCSRSISTGHSQSVSSHTEAQYHRTLPRMDGMATNGWRQAENNVSFISRRVAFLASIWLFCSKLNSFCTRQGRNTQWEASAAAAHLTTDKSSPETMEGSSCTKKKLRKSQIGKSCRVCTMFCLSCKPFLSGSSLR